MKKIQGDLTVKEKEVSSLKTLVDELVGKLEESKTELAKFKNEFQKDLLKKTKNMEASLTNKEQEIEVLKEMVKGSKM
jgi:uncharacterized tellurite resistance protein B-like protein